MDRELTELAHEIFVGIVVRVTAERLREYNSPLSAGRGLAICCGEQFIGGPGDKVCCSCGNSFVLKSGYAEIADAAFAAAVSAAEFVLAMQERVEL